MKINLFCIFTLFIAFTSVYAFEESITTEQGFYKLNFSTDFDHFPIRQMYGWQVKVTDEYGKEFIPENIAIDAEDIPALKSFALQNNIDLTIVGPEAPLVEGIVDEFQKDALKIYGPSAATALGDSVSEAQQNAYELTKQISWPDIFYRKDIGFKAI